MAYKILTEQEVYNIGGKGSPTANLLCTYARAQALGCTANGVTLSSNQLVYEGSVKKNVYVSDIAITIHSSSCTSISGGTSSTTITFRSTSVAQYNTGTTVTIESNASHTVDINVGKCSSDGTQNLNPSYSYSVTYDGFTKTVNVTPSCYRYCSCSSCYSTSYSGQTVYYTNNCNYAITLVRLGRTCGSNWSFTVSANSTVSKYYYSVPDVDCC